MGEGTTFFLYLPALPIQEPESIDSDVFPLVRGEGQMVLVVEDENITRQAIVGSLDMLGYRVLEAANGRDALALFEQHTGAIDLVLSDMIMPEMGGRALFNALKQRDATVQVLLLTGHPLTGEELADLSAQGLRGWLLKPPSLEQLAQAVAQALED
jgi:CheY-like chemotaxis protein